MSNIIVLGSTKEDVAKRKLAKPIQAEMHNFEMVINITSITQGEKLFYKFQIPGYVDTFENREELKGLFLALADSVHNKTEDSLPCEP